MDGHRYADDPAPGPTDGPPSWYAGRYDTDSAGAHAAGAPSPAERPSGAFRLPEQRVGPGETGSHLRPAETAPRRPVRGPEFPVVQPAAAPPPKRRPVSSMIVAFVMIVLMVPVVRLLLNATFVGVPSAPAVVPAVLLSLGFALTGIGLFGVLRGAPGDRADWLRLPVAYLPVGLVLLIAAGLAVA